MEVDGELKVAGGHEEREGSMLLGPPSFEDIGNGRLRCAESGHELPGREADAYGRSRSCRIAMIDAAMAKRKPLLNTFKPDPMSKSKLICKLTGDTINKSEEHIWKHITGRRFLHKLEQKELQKLSPERVKKNKPVKGEKLDPVAATSKKRKKEAGVDCSINVDASSNGIVTEEEEDFWMPPAGERWDFDDGKDRWGCSPSSGSQTNEDVDEDNMVKRVDGVDSGNLSIREKRMSIAVGTSSCASKKKKKQEEPSRASK